MPPIPSNLPIIFIVGGPGSGKGTQCEKISTKYGLTHLSSGDLLRAEVSSGSAFGNELKQIMDAGKLVELKTVLKLIKNAMEKAVESGDTNGFLIDGYPRDVQQGEMFESEIRECSIVLFFDASEETLINRLVKRGETSGRSDDNEETIRKRLSTFIESTKPVIGYYEERKKLVRVDADRTKEIIFDEVCQTLDPMFLK